MSSQVPDAGCLVKSALRFGSAHDKVMSSQVKKTVAYYHRRPAHACVHWHGSRKMTACLTTTDEQHDLCDDQEDTPKTSVSAQVGALYWCKGRSDSLADQ